MSQLVEIAADHKAAFVEAAWLPPVLALLEEGTDAAKELALSALKHLSTNNAENKLAITEAPEGLPSLITLLGASSAGLREESVAVLLNLSYSPDSSNAFVDAGGLKPLVSLLSQGNDGLTEKAASTLANVCYHSQEIREASVDVGALRPLIALIRDGDSSMPVKEKAVGAISNIAARNAKTQVAVADEGGLQPLIALAIDLKSSPALRRKSMRALQNLSSHSPANAHAIKKAGVEVEEDDGRTEWKKAKVTAVLVDGWFAAQMAHDADWIDWFTWQEENKDWRRAPAAAAARKGGNKPTAAATTKVAAAKALIQGGEAAAADAGGSPGAEAFSGGAAGKRKRVGEKRCGGCDACVRRDDCGECTACFDKPKFGGPGTKKQVCKQRRCINPKALDGPDNGGAPPPAAKKPKAATLPAPGKVLQPPLPGSVLGGGGAIAGPNLRPMMGAAAEAGNDDDDDAEGDDNMPPDYATMEPPALTPKACALPAAFTVAKRSADFPPWARSGDGAPFTKSMILAELGDRASSA